MEKKIINKNFKKIFNQDINLWLQWFIGFMDADGSFQTFPKKRSYILKSGIISEYINIGYGIHISLSDRDLPLLKEINHQLSNLVNPKIHNNFKLSGKIYTYPKRGEAVLAYTKLLDIQFLIENVFDKYPLITLNQRQRYSLLRAGILNKIKRLDNLEEYKKFKDEKTVATEYNFFIESESKNLLTGYSMNYEDSWMLGFINGEGSFTINKKGTLIFSIEHTDKASIELIKNRLELSPTILDRGQRLFRGSLRKITYSLGVSSKKDLNSLNKLLNNTDLIGLKGHKLIQYLNWFNQAKLD